MDVPLNPMGQLHSPGRTHCPPFRQAGLHIAGEKEEEGGRREGKEGSGLGSGKIEKEERRKRGRGEGGGEEGGEQREGGGEEGGE